ncbi:YqaA family protein [Pseudotabrizicola sp. L79]|uniref:YqaA family protein n=1 Tax=Pseudotabrizicola sp. L79 TaxID=3118402 RepID=UPI002F945896
MVAASLFGLFMAAFLAATPLPFQSEIVFLGLMAGGSIAVWLLVIVASVGNTLGSCVTYAAGRGLGGARGARWFPVRPDQLGRAERWFQRWGLWALLVSWAPGGDLIVALAGVLRVPFGRFLALVALAKTLRYIAVALLGDGAATLLARLWIW